MFDVELELCVYLRVDLGVYAYMDIRLLGQTPDEGGRARWKVVGRHDKRLPHVGKGWHEASWALDGKEPLLVLQTKNGHSWAKIPFPSEPNINSNGLARCYNLPIGPSKYNWQDVPGSYLLRWAVRRKGENRVIYDPGELRGIWQNLRQPTGWEYDTSAGGSGLGGDFFVGGGGGAGHFVFKRTVNGREEKCRVNYTMGAVGFMLPGAGASAATEDFPSYGTRVFMPAATATKDFPRSRFAGGITAIDLGLGYAHGGYDWYVVMLTNGIFKTGLPNPVSVKAFFYCRGASAATGSTEAAQLLAWAGSATLPK